MATTFLRTDDHGEIRAVAAKLIPKYFADIQEVETTFTFLWADSIADEKTGEKPPALKSQGYPAAATVKIVPYKDRVAGMTDVVITVDADWWSEHSERQREALIHHEIYHLVLLRAEDGTPRADDAGRPKFKLRKHDFQHGWFEATAKLYGPESVEVEQFAKAQEWMQAEIKFG